MNLRSSCLAALLLTFSAAGCASGAADDGGLFVEPGAVAEGGGGASTATQGAPPLPSAAGAPAAPKGPSAPFPGAGAGGSKGTGFPANGGSAGVAAGAGGSAGALAGGAASGASGAPGASGSGGSAAAGKAGSGPTLPEQCLDAVDNDGNGLTDCADPACTSSTACVAALPPGFQGYFHVRHGAFAPGAPVTPCDDGSAPQLAFSSSSPLNEHTSEPAACSPCTCGNGDHVACADPVLQCFWDTGNTCPAGGGKNWTAAYGLADGACHESQELGAGASHPFSCTVYNPVKDGSFCGQPSGGAVQGGAGFTDQHHVCPAPAAGAGCEAGKACAARGQGGEQICIRAAGAQACPAGFEQRTVAYASGSSTASCSQCKCALPEGACAGGAYDFFDPAACGTGHDIALVTQDTCFNLNGINDSDGSIQIVSHANLAPGKGSCAVDPSGGQPSGAFEKQGQVTYCCHAP